MEFRFDPNHGISYGYFTCDNCHASFYRDGVHKTDCPVRDKGYEACTYIFGPEEVKVVRETGRSPVGSLTLDVLERQFSDLKF